MSDSSRTQAWTGEMPSVVDRPSIPGYEILDELGRGGMGVVFKARQLSTDRLVALKLIRDAALAGPRERGRFRIEADATRRLQHPNVVTVYEVGEYFGQPYLAMELIEGGSLADLIRSGPLPVRYATEIVYALSRAMALAHDQKIVHRDLKPANILMAAVRDRSAANPIDQVPSRSSRGPSAEIRTPKITDFGLAKKLDSESTAWTQDGAILGTANYMAPEQAAGRSAELGPAVDIYALGAILYELLTGRPPFRAESWAQTLDLVLRQEPSLPTRLRPDVPLDLETICLKCLEKQPDRRYATALALADDLAGVLKGEAIAAVAPSATERLTRMAAAEGFQIYGEIGRGPGTIVFRGTSGPLKQPIALKVYVDSSLPREDWEARLRKGAEAWSALTHPQVLLIQRSGYIQDTPFVVMEHVPQGSLSSLLAGKPLSFRQSLPLLVHIADVICYMHRQGVVHGNLKPSNVLLAADGIPRVADLWATSGNTTPLDATATGLRYLAPEVLDDSHREPRPYTDIYGIGLLLYETLTGRPAVADDSPSDILECVRRGDPLPPSQINPAVPPALDQFCLRCLRKNPWRRFVRAYDVLARLRYFRDDVGLEASAGDMRSVPRRPIV